MGIVVSMLMITVGAIMRFAISATNKSFNIHTAGMILMIIGVIGAILSIAFWASWGGFQRHTSAAGTEQTVVREREIL